MAGRYLCAVIMVLLVAGWFAAGAYGWLSSNSATKLAESVEKSTRAFRQELEQPREDLLARRAFPQNRVVGAVRSAWSTGPSVSAFPQDVLGQPTAAAPAVRTR